LFSQGEEEKEKFKFNTSFNGTKFWFRRFFLSEADT